MGIVYAYPTHHVVSFTLIARKHVRYLRDVLGVRVQEVSEVAFPRFVPKLRYVGIVQPAFYIMHRVLGLCVDTRGVFREGRFKWLKGHYEQLVGVDVCDSDGYSPYAVELANRYDKFVVPSRFCVEVAGRAGVKVRVYRVPHGVDLEWYTTPNVWELTPVKSVNPALLQLYLYRIKRGRKLILFWLMHSAERKGWSEVREFYERLVRERRDVSLVLKTVIPNSIEYQQIMHLNSANIYGWLTEYEKMALYDLADITLNFSRGGGFELNCLESLARGVPCVASNWGSWTDYVPEYLRVKTGRKVQPLPNNSLHSGYGYTVDVDDALNKVHTILDSLDDFRARVLEYRDKYLSNEYRWDLIVRKLMEVVTS